MSILKSTIAVAFLGFSVISFAATNVALNAPVTLNGTFSTNGWGGPISANAATLTDNVFLPASTQWDTGTVWWNGFDNPDNTIQIDLGGQFSISSLILQADDNDLYPILYRNGAADPWQSVWNAPIVGGFGMQTRSSDPLSIVATSFLIGNGVGDGFYSVSEFQAIGAPVPEPETYALLLGGLGLIGFMTRRRKNE
ncbi:MAG: PEP-CTERM sorting domain-containing protein [Methylotenera sp.]|nr:PEP-CTERM sorting domain-containing protein [Methylotenera sp.]